MPKYIFVTGGVVSSLGKGIASASIGKLLECQGLKITLAKFDPYLNVDPGTMNPYQHGEVYVTEDGAETDLDLGHYERFTHAPIGKNNNVTTGQVYHTVIERERRGEYLGGTVQVIPHITDEIKRRIKQVTAGKYFDVVINEIGGTVGDIESLPFLEAIRQFRQDVGKDNVIYIHLTLVPYIKAAQEIKTKPTQHSVGKLREIGIQPDILLCRTEKKLTKEAREKIALFCNVEKEAVIEAPDVRTIYEVPLVFKEGGLDKIIEKKLHLKGKKSDLDRWKKEIVDVALNPAQNVKIAVVGKYIQLQDAYKSIYEALRHAGIANNCEVQIKKIDSENLNKKTVNIYLKDIDGILVPGGFGQRGIKGKIAAINYARIHKIPFLGICLGMQCAVIEFAQNVCGLKNANSTEFNKRTKYPVISLLGEQRNIKRLGGTMRLGAYSCSLRRGSHSQRAYKKAVVYERHRHRYEFNNRFWKLMEKHGLVIAGVHKDKDLVEIIELKEHPWFVATQFHPEFKSKPDKAHPLFVDFVKNAIRLKEKDEKKTKTSKN
ncbi:MAG TPA: CTP synthase [Candidatus Omnitrophica bacterium]|nr:CTP synthase [Candidatus Omnitrophota bacterium]